MSPTEIDDDRFEDNRSTSQPEKNSCAKPDTWVVTILLLRRDKAASSTNQLAAIDRQVQFVEVTCKTPSRCPSVIFYRSGSGKCQEKSEEMRAYSYQHF
ncbi:hypothetical protein RRG08_059996 [Elysia crispata]|uniref:Uncharacterized protein n=1 Tax=Elysia crispata TaxID=231223 RepID=A0AAE0YFL5_9GAST|nr:hypothetical protein RRG08_059996 [Elysia crispata]